jgi:7,8-dihydro-6-hydroxymethylpterin-pyrophosphokinase
MADRNPDMKKRIWYLAASLSLVCLGLMGPAFAEGAAPGPAAKDARKGLQEAMAFMSSVSNIEYQVKVSDKEWLNCYAAFKYHKCLIKLSDEISRIDTISGKTKGVTNTETTIDLSDIDTIYIKDAEPTIPDNQLYARATVSCRAHDKCIKDETIAENEARNIEKLDAFSFIVRKTKSKTELETLLHKAIDFCARR